MEFYPYTVESIGTLNNGSNNGTDSWTTERWIGISLALVANTITAASFNIQRYSHMKNAGLTPEKRVFYAKNPLWWVGFILLIIGETGNFMAYSFAPASLIAPLGAWSVVMNALIGKCLKFLNEKFRPRDIIGYIFTIAGGLLIIFFSPKDDRVITTDDFMHFISDPLFIVYISLLSVGIVAMVIAGFKWGKKYMLIYLLVTSMLGSITIMATKGFATFFVQFMGGNMDVLTTPLTWVLLVILVVTALVQVQYLNMVMQQFGTAQVMPIFFVMWNFWCILGTIILYQEFQYLTQDVYVGVLFMLGVVVTSVGVYFVAGGMGDKKHVVEESVNVVVTVDSESIETDGSGSDTAAAGGSSSVGASSSKSGKARSPKAQQVDNFADFPDEDAEAQDSSLLKNRS